MLLRSSLVTVTCTFISKKFCYLSTVAMKVCLLYRLVTKPTRKTASNDILAVYTCDQ